MNPELWMVFLPAVSWLLFALGGTQISDTIHGKKWTRRFVLPFIFAVSAGIAVSWWQGLLVGCIACAMFHQGYGIKQRWFVPTKLKGRWLPPRIAVFALYGLISAPIGLSLWNLVIPLWCSFAFWASNTSMGSPLWLAKMFVWKFWEGMAGLLIGFSVSYLLAL